MPADGLAYTFAVLPLTSGNLVIELDAPGELVDGRGRTRVWDFPLSYVTVADPWATSAPPAPSRRVGSLDVSVDPASVAVGEAMTVTHRLDVGCPALPMDLVHVLDGSSGMAGEPHERMKAAAGALVASLGLPAVGGDIRVGVVAFNSAATTLAPLTTDRVAVRAAIARVGATDGARLDVGLSETMRMLREGRPSKPNAGRDLVKAIVVMSKGDRGPGCTEIPTAHEAKGEGVLVLTVADDPADVCLEEAATSGRHALHAADVDALVQVVSETEISGRLSAYFDYVPDSAAPPLDSGPAKLPRSGGGRRKWVPAPRPGHCSCGRPGTASRRCTIYRRDTPRIGRAE